MLQLPVETTQRLSLSAAVMLGKRTERRSTRSKKKENETRVMKRMRWDGGETVGDGDETKTKMTAKWPRRGAVLLPLSVGKEASLNRARPFF